MENQNLPRRRKSKTSTICKKHPKHHQSPGVCSICLSEKLSKLPSTSSSRATTVTNASTSSSLSSLSSQCSSSASSCSSPMHDRDRNRNRRSEEGKGYLLSFLKSNKTVLTKSRSMATFVEERDNGIMNNNNSKKKKGGFWSKLLRSRSNNKRMMMGEGGGLLMHSRTMRDMLTTRI